MRAQTIALLSWLVPHSDEVVAQASLVATPMSQDRVETIIHYAHCHKNLLFGWDVATIIAQDPKLLFPAILHGDDLYVWRAYSFLKGQDDPIVLSALALTLPDNGTLAAQIKALLITDDITTGFIANKLGINENTIKAFEKLFFNVLDRKRDHAFLASIVYPEGRLVESAEDYIERTGMSDILLRAGFTRGVDHILYAMGLQDNPYGKKDVHDIANTLDKTFLADGCMFAAMGWANQKHNARPILNARASMIAGKMGKGDADQEGLPTITPGDIMTRELVTLSQKNLAIRQLKLQAHADAPTVPLVGGN